MNPLKPEPSLLCKIESIIVHVDEGMSKKGHVFDIEAFKSGMEDPEVKEWLAAMDKLALIPKRR